MFLLTSRNLLVFNFSDLFLFQPSLLFCFLNASNPTKPLELIRISEMSLLLLVKSELRVGPTVYQLCRYYY
jgi:hypothetical protein